MENNRQIVDQLMDLISNRRHHRKYRDSESENTTGFIMHKLYNSGGMSQTELGHILNVTNPRVTVILNDMERRGLVQRSPLASDRRTVIVSLTAEGKEAVENRIRQRRERLERFVDKIGPQDGEALIRILDAYRELEADERR